MEYITLTLSGLSFILIILISIIVIKNKKKDEARIRDEDLKNIQNSVKESINDLSLSVSSLIAEKNSSLMSQLDNKVNVLLSDINNLSKSFENFKTESLKIQKEHNKELFDQISKLNNDLNSTNKIYQDKLNEMLTKNYENQVESFADFQLEFTNSYNKQKTEILDKLSSEIKSFNEAVKNTLTEFNTSIKDKLEDFKKDNKESITNLSVTVNKNLDDIRKDNNEKLDKINESVNEKLQKTLEEKLQNSFNSVIEGFAQVNKAVGEIKGLATDVGSLKNVLTNVKSKGILGEVILGNIIREFLTAGQYEENIATKKDSNERVEFAIKLPGTKNDCIYLPIDSKFPYESYSRIQESSDIDEIKEAKQHLRSDLLKYAKDVSTKYIDVPNTTDFAIIFLPLEGLYLEALNMGLFEEIQSKYKVNLTGPTTLTAFINSLNMGFKSLLIQKKSADVFQLLGAVKTEFGKFADALEKTKNKVDSAADELEKLVSTRTRAMNKKLSTIEALDDETTKLIFNIQDEKSKQNDE